MFLFTTPPSSTPQRDAASIPVVDAIRYGAERSGTGFDYLLKSAQRESSLDPSATTKASSAAGLFQFIEQTWLGLVKGDGDKHGPGAYAAAIGQRDGGTVVAKLWTTGARRGLVETTQAAAYFPRSGETGLAEAAVASDATPARPGLAAATPGGAVPLPPARPADSDVQLATPRAAAVQPAKRAARARRPLDLSSFMQRRGSS